MTSPLIGKYLIHRPANTNQGKNVVSVKGGCLDGLDWGSAIHIWTKSAMVPIPEGSEAHPEEPSECSSSSSSYSTSQEILDQPPDPPGLLVGSGGCGAIESQNKSQFTRSLYGVEDARELRH